MPKASMHKYANLSANKHQVWFAGKVGSMKTVSKPGCEEKTADSNFRLRIPTSDASHIFTALCGGQAVHLAK